MAGALVIGPPEMNVVGNHFLASTFCTLGGLACMSYWLRRARDCTAITAVIYAFGALFVSELLIFTSIFMENGISYFYAAVLVLLQFPCILLARTKPLACDIKTLSNKGDFFNFTKNTMTSKVFLATICISIGVLACVDGFLRGYPDGSPIAFRATTRFADLVLILAFCIAIIVFTCRQHHRVMTVGIFVTMEALACIALLCYSAWPDQPQCVARRLLVVHHPRVHELRLALPLLLRHRRMDRLARMPRNRPHHAHQCGSSVAKRPSDARRRVHDDRHITPSFVRQLPERAQIRVLPRRGASPPARSSASKPCREGPGARRPS